MGILSESMREKINERELKASGSTQKENSLSRSMREKINERELKASGSTQKENSLSRSILNEDDSLFDIAITEGAKRNSAQSTEIINLKNSTGLPEDVVERNFNEVTQKNRQKQIDTKKFSQSNPEVSRWMSQSPNHAAAGYEDLTGLSYLERQIKYIRNQFKQGNRTVELAEIGEAALLGKATQQQRKRQNKIEEEQAQASDYDITGTIEEVPGAIAQQLPIIKSTIKGQIKGAGTGAIVGAGLGSVVPGIGTISGGVTGASFGWRYGAGVQAARQEAGLAYLEYEKIIDSKGRKIDRDVAVGASIIVGGINGAFEMVGFESIIKTVPGLRALSRKQVKQVLKSQSVNSTLYNYAKNVGLAIGAEGATEFIQEFVTITGKETVKAIKENRKITTEDFLSRIFSDDNISQALQAARAGAQAGGGIALSAGAVSSTIDYRKAKAAQVKAQNIEKTGQTVESLKLHKTSPKSVEQIVDNIAESKDVYIPSDTFQTYWQEKGIDPKQVISEVLGNTDQFDNAVETGQDIVIPAAKYYTSPLLGAGENKSFFAQEVRTDPLEMNAREWQDEIKRLDEEAVKIDESSAIGKDFLQVEEAPKIREAIKTKLTEAGFDNRTADSYAKLYESTFNNLGERTGIDPIQLFERFNPEISRFNKEQTKTFFEKVADKAKSLFQRSDQSVDANKKITDTPEFKNWFGDSKVVDEQGKPLVVYHGTNSDFERFDLSKSKMASKANPSDLGFWFVDDSTYASYHGNNVLETYVSLKNPKIYSSEQWNSINKKQDFKAIRESLIKQGHDGVITEESFDTLEKFNVRNPRLVVAFNPEQIKSVNNRETFDANDPRILFQDNNQDLFVQHNLTADNIRVINDLGGIAAPSLAVSRTTTGALERFGDITLIADKSILGSDKAKTFDADIYSPRFPAIQRDFDIKAFHKFTDGLKEVTKATGDLSLPDMSALKKDDIIQFGNNNSMKYAYLKSIGKAPKPKMMKLETEYKKAVKITNSTNQYEIREIDGIIKLATEYYEKISRVTGDKKYFFNDDGSLESLFIRDFSHKVALYNSQNGIDTNELSISINKVFLNKNVLKGYERYVTDIASSLTKKKQIFKGFSPSGNRLFSDYNLTNVVKEMTRTLQGGESFFYGAGNVRSAYAKQLKSINDIQKNREKIISSKDMEKFKKESQEKLVEALDELKQYYKYDVNSYSYYESSGQAIAGGPSKWRESFVLNNHSRKIITELVEYLQSLPTEYFEAKLQRAVFLNEFDIAVVPKNTPKDVIEILEREGLKIKKYDSTISGDRNRVIQGLDIKYFFQDKSMPKGAFRFGDGTFNIYLLEKADLSTFLHETGHFFLEMVGELAESSQASSEIKSYYKDVLEYLGVESRDQIATEHHEKFARGFEAYLMYGKAPSTALRRVFARFKVWLTNIYGTLKSLEVELTDDVRSVFDRLVASDKQIQEVEGEINISPLFEDTTILGNSAEKYKQAIEDFRMEVAERATSKMMKEYQREHKQWYKDELNNQREIVKQEMFADRAYIALTALQKGELPDGTPYSPETIPPKLSRKEVESIIGEERTKNLPRGIFAKDGAHPAILADLFQFRSDVALLEALESVEKPKDRIERVSKERMKELFPNLEDQQNKFREEILKDIHNEKRSEILRFELKWLAEEAPTILKDAIRKVSRRVPSNTDVKAYAKSVIDKSRVSKIEPNFYLRAEKAAARNAGISLAKGDLDEAFEQKRIELLNHELYKQAVEAKEQIRYSLDNFKKIAIADKKLSKTRDGDLVNAARAVLAGYGIGYEDKRPETFLENMRLYAPETYFVIYPLVQSVLKNGADYRSISFSDFTDLNNVVQALWELSRFQKQIEIDGQKIERDEIIEQLNNRIFDISKPKERVGYNKAVTKWEKTKMGILGIRASLRRVESWVDAMDGGNPSGVFRKYIWNPISEATTKYRVQKKEYIQKYLDILKKIENNLTWKKIQSPELNYEFSDKAELLGAMLHTGNRSNLEKLLRGRGWGEFNENGVLDRSRWDVFVKRMQDTGVLNKSDYDYLQSVWDLLEELKPFAQKAHKAMYGYYFNEVTADSFDTPFGKYRGGYVPALIDPLVSNDQEIRLEREQLEGLNNSYMFPTTGRGFTQSRVERYAAPLQMNIRFIAGHIDKVLRFVNIEPHVKDVGKIVMNRSFSSSLNEFDSSIAGDMLVPWLQRTAKQQVETPSASRGGRAIDRFFRGVRKRTALNIMVGNVVNTIQQFTGLSMAMVKVPPKYMRNALWQYVKSPEELSDIVNEKSAFMNTRMATSVIEIQNTIDDLIINQNKYEKARDFALQHGYFMQAGTQNIVDIITWVGRYNQMVESGADEQLAVREADSCVRQTQGSFNAEDISRFESGSPFIRAFTMFYSYFNMQANLLGTEFQKIIRDIGLKKGAGRLLYVYVFGFMIPAVLSEMIVRAMSGKYDEDDDDIYLDDTLNAFFGAQSRSATAMFPVIGPIIQLGINTFNDKWYDDRISTSPAVSMIQSAAKAPHSVYAAISEDKSKKAAVRDTLSAIGLFTGFPVVPIARPIGYMIDIDEGKAEPTGLIDLSRGLITGKSGN